MIAGRIIMDGIGYAVAEGLLPVRGTGGEETGQQKKIKSLFLKDNASGFSVEVRMTPQQFDDFAAALSGRKTIIPSGLRL